MGDSIFCRWIEHGCETGSTYNFAIATDEKRGSKAEVGSQRMSHTRDLERQLATPCSAEYLIRGTVTGSGVNLAVFQILSSLLTHNSIYIKIYIYVLDRQWATATSTVKSNYFRFATVKLNFMCNELYKTLLNYKPSDYHVGKVLHSFLHGPCCRRWDITTSGTFHHIENSQTWSPTLFYTHLRQIGPTPKATTFVSVKCVVCIITFIFAAVTAVFPTYKSLYRPATKNHN